MITRHSKSRTGFTLTELLIAMTVIAILIGMLATAIIPVLTRAKETAIQMEMKQIEGAIETFKNEHGFYPPSWVNIRTNDATGMPNTNNQCATELMRYINKLAPNNGEGAGAIGSRPVDVWWLSTGQHISHGTGQDLVFWLSGLAKNKQAPLSSGGGVAFDDSTIDRQVYYEFRSAQLVKQVVAGVEVCGSYEQAADSGAPFVYIDSRSYGVNTAVGGFDGYHVRDQRDPTPANWTSSYENPNSFQLICFGMDKMPGDSPSGIPSRWCVQTATGLVDFAGVGAEDNLCNFCEGRLERYINGTSVSPAVK